MILQGSEKMAEKYSSHPLDVEPDPGIRNKSTTYQMGSDRVKIIIQCPGLLSIGNLAFDFRVREGHKSMGKHENTLYEMI